MVFSVITAVLLTLQILKKIRKYGDYVLAKFEENRSQKFYVAIVEGVDMEIRELELKVLGGLSHLAMFCAQLH